ncbi:MAG: ATP-dependent RecD-like DNA helicase [Christensenellaceae bacterium]
MSYIEGIVVDIVYRNEENGYTVLELDAEGNLIICVGSIPLIQPGEYVRFYGAYTTHKTYGRQFKVTGIESKMPETDESIRLFLSGGLIKGVGEIIAYRIVDVFHEETFAIIENEPERLAEIQGISLKMARSIHEQFMGMQTVRSMVMQLQKLGLSINEAMVAYETYGASAPFLIAKNPYRLMDDIRGFGFVKADRIAQGLGIDEYESLRRESALRHMLQQKMAAGHTCFPADALITQTAQFLGEEEALLLDSLLILIRKGTVSENVYNGIRAISEEQAYLAESYAAYKLVQLQQAEPKVAVGENVIEEVLLQDTVLSEEQERAVSMAVAEPISLITGGPGTGKTTILNQVLHIFERSGIVTLLAAPTGRAAKRMEMATGRPAKTIHRLLEYGAEPGDEIMEINKFRRDEDNPIEADALIIDESSMIDIFLLRSLLAAVEPGTRLIFTGDADQLPSVGPGNVLKDMLHCGVLPYRVLTEVFRAGGNIVLNAHRVNQGEKIELFETGDFVFYPTRTAEEAMEETMRQYLSAIAAGGVLEETQILCPVKKGVLGINNINMEIRERINPRLVGKAEITFGETIFREGDKIMQTVNNYGKEWHIKGASEILTAGTGVFNGDMGVIDKIDTQARLIYLLFDGDRIAEYEHTELIEIEHAYAVTVHKSQGSEFDTVILPLFYGYSDFLTRNLLYTALTRAKKKLIIIGKQQTIENMIRNAKVSLRYTALDHELKKEQAFLEQLQKGESRGGYEEPLLNIFAEPEEGDAGFHIS